VRDAIHLELGQTLALAGIRNGPVNFDVIVGSDSTPTVLEMRPRFGGNCIPEIIRHGTGFDEVGAAIDFAVGDDCSRDAALGHDGIRPTGSRILGSRASGVLQHITPRRCILEKYGYAIIDLVYDAMVGDPVKPFSQGNHRLGHIVASAPTLKKLDRLLDEIEREMGIRV
jgi:hypothetical protein